MSLAPEQPKPVENILWGLANFFLQLFVWGSLFGLFFYWASIWWDGLFVLAFVFGLVGTIWAVVPLWLILYPKEVRRPKPDRGMPDRGMPDWLWKTFLVASVLLGMVIFAALSSAWL